MGMGDGILELEDLRMEADAIVVAT